MARLQQKTSGVKPKPLRVYVDNAELTKKLDKLGVPRFKQSYYRKNVAKPEKAV